MSFEKKSGVLDIKNVNGEERTFDGVVAVYHNIDDGGDIYAKGAFDPHMDFFKSNGVVRDEHEVTTGKIVDAKSIPEGLYIKGKISNTPEGERQLTLLRDGVYKFLSVGAKNGPPAGKYEWLDEPEAIKSYWDQAGYRPTEDELLRAGARPARLITKSKPYEASTTFAPMNEKTAIYSVKSSAAPAGRRLADHLGMLLDQFAEATQRVSRAVELRSESGRELGFESKALLNRLATAAAGLSAILEGVELDEKGVVAFSAAPIVEGAWDAAEAKARIKEWASKNGKINFVKYRRAFACFDSAKPDDLGSYKLPHHDIRDGKFVTVKSGVEAAAGAIDGSRGGVDIPEAEREKVKAHLAKHYAQWGGEPPWKKSEKSDEPAVETPPVEPKTAAPAPESKEVAPIAANVTELDALQLFQDFQATCRQYRV
jgi:hypothetical protein